jgi:hypothetical protein
MASRYRQKKLIEEMREVFCRNYAGFFCVEYLYSSIANVEECDARNA